MIAKAIQLSSAAAGYIVGGIVVAAMVVAGLISLWLVIETVFLLASSLIG